MKKLLLLFIVMHLFTLQAYAGGDAVARVNGTAITINDMEVVVDTLIPRTTFHGNVSKEKRNELREKALALLIDRELQYQDAVARKINLDANAVKKQMSQVRDGFRSKKEYKAALAEAGLTEDELRERFGKSTLAAAVIEQTVTGPANVNDDEVRTYYEKNADKFVVPESVRLNLISIKDEKRAAEALRKIRSGEDFGNVAASMSEDSYRVKRGDFGYLHRGRLLPEIEDKAFTLATGQLSELINADGMYFIVQVADKKVAVQLSFNEVKDKLMKDLKKKRQDDLMQKWMSELRAKAKIEVLMKFTSEQ